MAMYSTNLHGSEILASAANFLARVGAALTRSSHAYSRMERVEELTAKSDDQLAELGITREQIVYHVYKDFMHL